MTYEYDAANQLIRAGDKTYTYDRNGNLASETTFEGTTLFTWDYENRLASITDITGKIVQFAYDPLGRQISRADPDGSVVYSTFLGDRLLVRGEKSLNGALVYDINSLGQQRIKVDATRSVLVTDRQGTLISVVNANTSPERYSALDAFGKNVGDGEIAQLNSHPSAFLSMSQTVRVIAIAGFGTALLISIGLLMVGRFGNNGLTRISLPTLVFGLFVSGAGMAFVLTSTAPAVTSTPVAIPSFGAAFGTSAEPTVPGLYLLNRRYYDSTTGRFISRDPLGFAAGDLNLYVYAGNNPATLSDYSGLAAQDPVLNTLHGLVDVGGVLVDFYNSQDRKDISEISTGVSVDLAVLAAGVVIFNAGPADTVAIPVAGKILEVSAGFGAVASVANSTGFIGSTAQVVGGYAGQAYANSQGNTAEAQQFSNVAQNASPLDYAPDAAAAVVGTLAGGGAGVAGQVTGAAVSGAITQGATIAGQ